MGEGEKVVNLDLMQGIFSYDCSSYILNFDINNLCGHSMMQLLSTEILCWVDTKDFNLDIYSNDSPIWCFLDSEMGLSGQFQACLFLFFYEKILYAQKAPKLKTSDFHLLRSLCTQKIKALVV